MTTLNFASFMKLLRLSLTNAKKGPPVLETMQLLGKQKCVQYLTSAIDYATINEMKIDS